MPKIGKTVTTAQGKGKVVRHNTLQRRLAVRLNDGPEIEIGPEELITEKDTREKEDTEKEVKEKDSPQ